MSTSSVDDENADAALPPMALLATLQTATTVWEGLRERREGRDPAGQEAAGTARAYLDDAAGELTRLHMQLLMAKVQADRASPFGSEGGSDEGEEPAEERSPAAGSPAAAARRFDLLMKLRRTDRLLHGAHQRLMSLYPAVSEELVEEARHCQGELSRLRNVSSAGAPPSDDASLDEALALFLQRLLSFATWTQREL
ncbi:MAG: hypothetical protein BRD46_04105 [Bacteroidetes bacterium QS_8_68_15]|nr:MAG: hypothetical protein BRD46_04105 [Bacteroidetes bacterium QS_8_68_15]